MIAAGGFRLLTCDLDSISTDSDRTRRSAASSGLAGRHGACPFIDL